MSHCRLALLVAVVGFVVVTWARDAAREGAQDLEVLSRQQLSLLTDPILAAVIGALVSVLWFLISYQRKRARQLEQGWHPATEAEVTYEVEDGLRDCSLDEREFFAQHRVPPVVSPIWRYGREEQAWIVARRGYEVILWDDREGGFEITAVDDELRILEHWRNQYELHQAVSRWMRDLPREGRGPEMPIPLPESGQDLSHGGRDGGARE